MSKAMTLRLDDERAALLEMVARAEDQSVADAIRSAIDEHIERRRGDKDFQARLRRLMEEDRAILERLAQ